MLRTYCMKDKLVLHNYKIDSSYPMIAVDQDTILILLDAEPSILKQWDSAFRKMLNIEEHAKYLIVDMGQPILGEENTYQVPCLCMSNRLAESIEFDGRVCTI